MEIGRKHNKSVEQYRHNIKLLKYHLKKQQRINQTLKYKSVQNDKKAKSQIKKKNEKPKQKIYSMLQTVSKLSQRMKVMGLSLADIFRMADAQYQGQINKGQFLKVVNQLKADLDDGLIQELFYAIDTNMNGILDEGEYLQFLCAYGGADSKDALKFQKKTLEKFASQLKKKSIKSEGFLADSMDPISANDFKKKLQSLTLNENEKMILLKAFDPQNSGHINHDFFIQQTKSIKQKTEQTIKNQELQKDIKHMCAKWRQNKVNPIKVFEEADTDKKDGISPSQLEDAFIRLMPQQTKFTIKKWVKLINFNNDNEITREEFTNSIRSFYALNQLQKFSADYEKQNPNARRGIKNEEMPTQKILKKLGQKIIVEKMTNKQAFKSMDINGDETLSKEQLAEGLKKFGFHIVDVGRILSVFDRDVSQGVDVIQWCKILGQDVEFQEVQSDFDSDKDEKNKIKKDDKKVLKNNTSQNKKEDKSKKADPIKKTEPIKKNQPLKKQEVAKKTDTSKKIDKDKSISKEESKKKITENSNTKPIAKSKQVSNSKDISTSKPKQKQKQESPTKPSSKKIEPKISAGAKKVEKKYESQAQQRQQQQNKQIDISEIEKQVGIEYKKHPKKVFSIFKKYDKKGKPYIQRQDLKKALNQLKISVNADQLQNIFMSHLRDGKYFDYKDWLDKTSEQNAQDVDQEQEEQPKKEDDAKLKIKKTQSKLMQSKSAKDEPIKNQKKENKEVLKPKKVQEKEEDKYSDLPNQSDLKSVRSIRSVTSNNPRQQIVAEKLSKCIQSPKEFEKLEKEYLPKADQLKKSKKKFQDKSFPADTSSITKSINESKINNAKNLKWKHYSQFLKQPQLFKQGINPNDILQGGLGNCYFLSALACLAQYPNLIQRLFEYADIDTGYFLVWLCIDGVWSLIQIDGYIVVNPQGTQPNFTRSKQGELWVVLLQKAYAKAYGGFENIVGGDASNAIRDLSGSPSKYFEHSKVKQQELWDQLFSANQNKFIMSTGTDISKGPQIKVQGRQQNVTAEGLVMGHAYSILDIREEGKDKIIQLRNPWGTEEWKGDWSDGSKKWTSELKQKLNYQGGDDGIFWMPFKDFFTKYKSTGINYLRPDYFYQSQSQPKAKNLLVKVSHYELKELFIGISQADKRHKGKAKVEPYSSVSFVSLICQQGDQIKVLKKVDDKNWIDTKEVQIQFQKIQQNQEIVLLVKLSKETDITISVYSNCQTDFTVTQLSDEDDINYSEGVAFLAQGEKKNMANGFQFWSSWVGQRAFFCVKNVSSSSNKFTVQFNNPLNMEFININKPSQAGKYVLDIQKGKTKSIKAQIKDRTKPSGFGQFSL